MPCEGRGLDGRATLSNCGEDWVVQRVRMGPRTRKYVPKKRVKYWSENFWIQVIDTKMVVEEELKQSDAYRLYSSYSGKREGKWTLIIERLRLDRNKVKPKDLASRFWNLKNQVQDDTKRTKSRKTVLPTPVVKKMKECLASAFPPSKSHCKHSGSQQIHRLRRNARQGDSVDIKAPTKKFIPIESPSSGNSSEANKSFQSLKQRNVEDKEDDLEDFKSYNSKGSPCSKRKNVSKQRNVEDKEEDSEDFKSAETSPESHSESLVRMRGDSTDSTRTQLLKHADRDFCDLEEWFCHQLIPIARKAAHDIISSATRGPRRKRLKLGLGSDSCTSEDLLDESALVQRGLPLAMLEDFQNLRAEISHATKQTIKNLMRDD